MVADEHFVIRILENIPLDARAALLCAGITVYSPVKYYGLAKPGVHIRIVGLGGLGHVAVKFAKAARGTMNGVLHMVSAVHPIMPLIDLLKSSGRLLMVGAPDKPLELFIFPLLIGRKGVSGSSIRGIKEAQYMIDFAANITAEIELISMDYVNTAMERLAKKDVRYRFVIDIANTLVVP